ncbi:putative ATP-dependent zinc metallopeptidase, putative,metallo-peptidase, clan MA(E), family M41 [Trypanosoma theileri]|uniref:Putative ATP-dependent zinc metallopeptidase, putative,metallo-peptidase, clan MA(E), family M41 n=1 Tax=Trypanosoma theileri TaxID=67003 RepID=A0A1X0NJP5_9TRYP|nr:putative ATP-dependent zinc metallopeptidase, putative,metallo-peptidase, clan MA(E), family M41 [Trypanosoma theileri]ORC84811.1 putative ATP-dependent zinc metallopeptidase, putative,metallo-peptidase, clan MA(E), family M41 [Trypanosoma theileri]
MLRHYFTSSRRFALHRPLLKCTPLQYSLWSCRVESAKYFMSTGGPKQSNINDDKKFKRLFSCSTALRDVMLSLPSHTRTLLSLENVLLTYRTMLGVKHADLSKKPDGDGSKQNEGSNKKKNDGNKDDSKSSDDDGNEEFLLARALLFVLVMFGVSYVLYKLSKPFGKQTGWASLIKHADLVESIHLYHNYAQVYLEDAKVYLGLVDDQHTQERLDQLRTAQIKAKLEKKDSEDSNSGTFELVVKGTPLAETALVGLGIFAWVVPFVFFPVFVMILSNSIGKSLTMTMEAGKKSQKIKDMVFRVEHTSNTRFHDIAGMKEAKHEITEVVDFLRHPERYTSLGAKIPTGALLLGPPGTGKTLLAKAVAGESGVGFIPVCGSDFVELYVGMGALRVRQLFEVAKKQRCVVYIDEIDAIGLKRSGAGHGEKQEQEHTLNELLAQLDGFSTASRGDVMILASSNVPQEQLDPALIRPGRFDRIIHIDVPVLSERVDIFKVHLSGLKLVDKEDEMKDTAVSNGVTSSEEAKKKKETTTNTEKETETIQDTSSNPTHPKEDPNSISTTSPTTTTTTTTTTTPSSGGDVVGSTALVVGGVQAALEAERERLAAEERRLGHASFDFTARLARRGVRERALLEAYAARMADLCPGLVGADIASVCNEAAILAAREAATHVDVRHLERSVDRVLAGVEHRSRILTPFERRVVAHHEAGHAVAGWFLHRADPLMKVSIVPRGGSALGYAQYLPSENSMRTAVEVRDSICVTLGGRVAEKIFFNHLSTGASDDLRKVTQMAYMYVSAFESRAVFDAPGSASTRIVKPFGPKLANLMDEEAKKLVDELYDTTYKLLMSKKEDMAILAKHLLEKEVLTYDDVVRYLGRRTTRPSDRKKRT